MKKQEYSIALGGNGETLDLIQQRIPNAKKILKSYDQSLSIHCYDFCFIAQHHSDGEVGQRILFIEDFLMNIKAKVFIVSTPLPLGTTEKLSKKYNLEIVFLSIIRSSELAATDLKLIVGGSNLGCDSIANLFATIPAFNSTTINTNAQTAELMPYFLSSWQAILICHINDFFNISEEIEIDFTVIHNISKKLAGNSKNKFCIDCNHRGFSNRDLILDLEYLILLMKDSNLPTFNIEGILRNNIFNKRRSSGFEQPISTQDLILFYNIDEPFGFLSNFSDHPILCKGIIWKTTEHYFQAQKFSNRSLEEKIRLSNSPMSAKNIAKEYRSQRLSEWDRVKNDIMYKALYAKFTQHPDLRSKLLLTGNAEIREHTSNDFYWADGGDSSGKNILGKLLMKLRGGLANKEKCICAES